MREVRADSHFTAISTYVAANAAHRQLENPPAPVYEAPLVPEGFESAW
ncbi:hypothetical protein [Nocardia panacis]|nr:hypothetical protein [Nocardia panacis]